MFPMNKLECGYNNFSLKISFSEINSDLLFVIGPNGTGKSTLLKTLAGILDPKSGTLVQNHSCSYLPPQQTIQPGIWGKDILELYDYDKSSWYSETLADQLGVTKLFEKKIEHLSSGELQRVLLCSVLSHPSPVVLMDEPLTYLDWFYTLKLSEIIQKQYQQGRKFIIANHNLGWSLRFPQSSTWVLFQNQIFLSGKTIELLNSEKFMEIFKIKTEITDNPMDNTKLLAVSNYETKKEH